MPPAKPVMPSPRTLLTAAYSAEAHLGTAAQALKEAKWLIGCLGAAMPHDLDTDVADAVLAVGKIRAKLDIMKKRIP